MSLWWLQPSWTETTCCHCGAVIYPEGDPDWGLCWPCMNEQAENERLENERRAWEEAEMEKHFREHPHG